MTKEDKLFLALVEDKIGQCEENYMVTTTGFLDIHKQTLISDLCKSLKPSCKVVFFGGYEEAERNICMFLPDYAAVEDYHGMAVIRAKKSSGSKALSHRDYLGALLGLGIKRDVVGDILVHDDGADIILLNDIADFVLLNYDKAGRTSLALEKIDITNLRTVDEQFKFVSDTVASLRLDNIVSSAFGLSRSKAAEAIKRGIVFLNNLECFKVDKEVAVGDKIVLRGKGKVYLMEIGGKSRKDRTYITLKAYI